MDRQNSIVATYLFAWNPKLWDWPSLTRDRAKLARQGYLDIRWASGRVRAIEPGSRAFLMRLGVAPKGLFGDGVTMTAPTEGVHWREDKRRAGIPALYLRLRLNTLFALPVVTLDDLTEPPFAGYRWTVRQSGAYVPYARAEALERLWDERVAAMS
jgi:5-methylcytosine-specific restriction protein A